MSEQDDPYASLDPSLDPYRAHPPPEVRAEIPPALIPSKLLNDRRINSVAVLRLFGLLYWYALYQQLNPPFLAHSYGDKRQPVWVDIRPDVIYDGRTAWVHIETLAEALEMPVSSVKDGLKTLKKHGHMLLSTQKRYGHEQPAIYRLKLE